jgi:hypothetical protein
VLQFEIPAGWLEPAYLEEIAANQQWLFGVIGLVSEYFNHEANVACKLQNSK